MDEYEAIIQAQHHYCEMASLEYSYIENSVYPDSAMRLAAEFIDTAYQLGKIIDKMAAEI